MATNTIDPNGLIAATGAVTTELNTITYFGINVGSKATPQEITKITQLAIQTYLDFLSAPKI